MISVKQVVRVKPGHRIEVAAPELAEGRLVDVTVRSCPNSEATVDGSLLAFLDSLPAGPRAFSTWEEYEQHRREERDSWDR